MKPIKGDEAQRAIEARCWVIAGIEENGQLRPALLSVDLVLFLMGFGLEPLPLLVGILSSFGIRRFFGAVTEDWPVA